MRPRVEIASYGRPDMIIAIATFRCQEDKKQDWLDCLAGEDGLVKTRAFEGCQLIETLISPDSSTVMLYEKWDTVEHHQAYVGWRLANGLGEMLEEMLSLRLRSTTTTSPTSDLAASPAGGAGGRYQTSGVSSEERCELGDVRRADPAASTDHRGARAPPRRDVSAYSAG